MQKIVQISSIALILLFLFTGVKAQDTISAKLKADTVAQGQTCETLDATDYIRKWFHLKKKTTEKTSSFFIAPVFGSTPSTGFLFGIALSGAFQLPESNMSAFQANVQYTAKKQFTLSLKNNVFATGNKIFLSGDWSYYDNVQPTYGLGTNSPTGGKLPFHVHYNDVGEPADSLVQHMEFKYLKLHQTFSFNAWPNFFIGPGIHLDYYNDIKDLDLDTIGHKLTSHYTYSKNYGYNPEKYTVNGLSLNIVYDTRDNMISAYKGIYANVNYRLNKEFLGSDQNSSSLWTEFRSYLGVSKKKPQNVLAFWYVGNFSMSGDLPYLNLPFIGNDQRQKTGRGYTIARFRGQDMVYGEVEYRFAISKCTNTLGAVVFANATTTNNKDKNVGLFDYIQPGFGAGIRILFQKKSRMNIQVDYGQGDNSGGIYFGATEVF
jgi:outer membrane protein assembly factor BamA